jgi:hypothetical protein
MTCDRRAIFGIASALAVLALGGCGGPGEAGQAEAAAEADTGYADPPQATAVLALPGGGMTIVGRAAPDARVRATTPSGDTHGATAGADGIYRLDLPASDSGRLVSLSVGDADRAVAADGWLFIPPDRPRSAAMLRPGAAARPLAQDAGLIGAVDYDAAGGVAVAGFTAPETDVQALVDGRPAGDARSDGAGFYSLRLDRQIAAGTTRIAVRSGDASAQRTVRLAAATPSQVFSATRQSDGWRIDWLTPGGGVQTTQIFFEADR